MARRRCLGPAPGARCPLLALAPPGHTRCPTCTRAANAHRNAARTWYGPEWAKLSKATIADHRARYGNWCPGLNEEHHDPHPCSDLTADHIIPRSLTGGLRVICRSLNSSLGARRRP